MWDTVNEDLGLRGLSWGPGWDIAFPSAPIESPTSFQDFLSTSQGFIVSRSSTFSLAVHRIPNDFLSTFHDFLVSRYRLSSNFQREKS